MNLKLFKKNLRSLYKDWERYKQKAYGGSDVLVVSTSPISSSHSISDRFCLWLLGYVFADTTAIFTSKEIHYICPKHKVSLLKALTSSADEAVNVQLIVHEKAKGDDGLRIVDDILSNIRVQFKLEYLSKIRVQCMLKNKKYEFDVENNKDCTMVVGHVEKESVLGCSTIIKKKPNEFCTVDIRDGLSKFVKVDAGENKDISKENMGESAVVWGFKRSDERDVDIYLQKLSKEAEEKILLAEVSQENPNLRRRGKKVEAIGSEIDEWIFV
ncbi:Fact complex subunit spt16 [Thalictrum thalictroides]|uniref:FACT complex subunit n=1 Tax=Thalictrum thalictroides TaxID=46969 RepID=A0A7J6WX52_THATH|nr:Fact complex subunit spt16 [Thalictrum thalictroides]